MWYNPIMVWLLESPLHGILSGNMMVVSYTGRKSGKIYQIPIGYKRVDNYLLLTISYKRRIWWRNLRGGVPVTVHLQGKDVHGLAEVMEDEEGVIEGMKTFIGGNQRAASMFGVKIDKDGQLELASMGQAAKERVVVRTTLI